MKAMRGLRILVSILLVMTAMVATTDDARAQGFQGAIRGLVKDAGGVVPGADVTLVREETSVSRSTTTNEAGEYTFPNLLPGTYTLKLALQGYKGYAQAGIQVGTQQFITIDVALEVGAVAETVTVNGQSPLIETSTASTGTVLDTHTLQTLPSPGRAAFLIGTSVPTVIPSGDTQFNRQQDQTNASLLSLGGGTRRGNNYTLDGVPITDLRNRASANPTIESLEDLKVQVHTYDAEWVVPVVACSTRRSGPVRTPSEARRSVRRVPSGVEPTTISARRPVSPSPTAPTISVAAASAARSSKTGRSSGSRRRAITTCRRATRA